MKRNEIGIFSTCTGIRELEKALVSVKELGLYKNIYPVTCPKGELPRLQTLCKVS